VAAGCASLVFALGLLAVSPALHSLVHATPAGSTHTACTHHHPDTPPGDDADHTCAVVLFAQGLALSVQTVAPESSPVVWHAVDFPAAEEQLLAAPRYLLQPERGPPQV
jgi:hypothetical protein